MVLAVVSGTVLSHGTEIHVDAGNVVNASSPLIYGACIEDVNHEIYGGLYGQRLYGESFEEPAPPIRLAGWTTCGGDWLPAASSISTTANSGAKIVREQPPFLDGTLEFDIRFTGTTSSSNNAGALVRVRNPGTGADAFDGYEISLASNGTSILLGRHQQDWKLLKSAAVAVDSSQWQHLSVVLAGARIQVFLNAASSPAIDCVDAVGLPAGTLGLRTWGANAQFQNLKTSIGGHAEMHLFDGAPAANVSGQWDPVQTGGAQVKFSIDSSQSYNSGRSQCVEFVSGKGTAGVANQGLNRWGVAVKKGTTYVGRVYLRATGLHGEVTVSLQSLDGAKVYASQALSGVTGAWAKFPYTLVSNADDGLARFVISINSPGTLWIDQAVLMEPPTGRFQGLPVREDIANAMVAGKLSFLRYGGTAVNAPEYRWKKMTGDPDRRAQYQGHWHPYTSNGFGMIEFVAFCERAGIQAAFAINVEETPQDMADMIEYLNGDATSPCGSARAADGHPKPYGVKYIEIGNEEVIWGDVAADYDHYVQRFKLLAAAMRQKDPNLIFINAAWWRGNNTNCERVFKALNG